MKYTFVLGIVIPILVWYFASVLFDHVYLPSPQSVFFVFWNSESKLSIFEDIGNTVIKTLFAFVVSNVFGLVCGYLISLKTFLSESTEFTIDFVRSVPAAAFFPIFMIIFGFNDISKTALVTFGMFWIVVFGTIKAMQTISKTKIMIFKSLGASYWDLFHHYYKFILFEHFLSISKIVLSVDLFMTVTFEMFIGSEYGIGKSIIQAKNYYEISLMYFWIIVAGVVGYGLNQIVVFLQNKYDWKSEL
jgi:ABC-type nitrate/sulfonate/bicarbonate transport system permease component